MNLRMYSYKLPALFPHLGKPEFSVDMSNK